MSLLRSGLAAYRATGAEIWIPHFLALVARGREAAGDTEEGSAFVDEALQIVERTGECWFAAELNRQKGQLLLRQGDPEAAESLYRKALGIAREQEARPGNCAPPRALRACGATRVAPPKPASFSGRSTAGSPKGPTPPISKRRKRCSTNCVGSRLLIWPHQLVGVNVRLWRFAHKHFRC